MRWVKGGGGRSERVTIQVRRETWKESGKGVGLEIRVIVVKG